MKVVKAIKNKTHLNEGCQAPLFRFKDECGMGKSLVAGKSWETSLYRIKDLTPGCSSSTAPLHFTPYYTCLFAVVQPAAVVFGLDENSGKENKASTCIKESVISNAFPVQYVETLQNNSSISAVKSVNYRFVKQ